MMTATKLPAFSLIEMAIVLIIMGVIGSLALPGLKGVLTWQKSAVTVDHQEKILYALAGYALQKKCLPYAADPLALNGNQDLANRRCRGILPYRELGLSESMAKDGYHRWFTYVVDDACTSLPKWDQPARVAQPSENPLCKTKPHAHSLKIRGIHDNAGLVLISHGPEGRGAYPTALMPAPQGSDELLNSTSEQEIVDRPISQVSSNPFSHKVVWVTSQNLLAVYGRTPCVPPQAAPPSAKLNIFTPEQPSTRATIKDKD